MLLSTTIRFITVVIAYEQAHSFVRVSRAKRRMCPHLILLAGFAGAQFPNKWACSQATVVKCCGLTRPRLVSPQQILTTVVKCIVGDKSTDHAKPHSICFFTTISMVTKKIFVKICWQLKTPTRTWKCTRSVSANKLLVRVRLSFQKRLQTRSTCRKNAKQMFLFTKIKPRPQVFSAKGSMTCSGLHFWRHFDVIDLTWQSSFQSWSTAAGYGELCE